MNFVSFLLISVFSQSVWGNHQIVLQFIGDKISPEDQDRKDFCEPKYCLLDSAYLFYGATQNKSVKPCDDFKEFALGTFVKYKAISDSNRNEGFITDMEKAYNLRLRKVLAAKVNEKDTRVTKAIKKLYAKCVDSKYLRENALNEMRAYLKSFGLKFYPDENRNDFNILELFESQPNYSIRFLLQCHLLRTYTHLRLRKEIFPLGQISLYFKSIADLLYDLFEVYKENSANNEKFKVKFKAIAEGLEFFSRFHKKHLAKDWEDEEGDFMTIAELNNLTASLNLDWLKIINNQLSTKVALDEKLYVESPRSIKNLANFLATIDKKLIADYFAYNFIYDHTRQILPHFDNKWEQKVQDFRKNFERWTDCFVIFIGHMNPALLFLYVSKYGDKVQDASMKKFVQEAGAFAVKKIQAEDQLDDNVKKDLVDRVSSIKVITSLPDDYLQADKIEELYAHLQLSEDQNYVETMMEIELNYKRMQLEPKQSEISKLIVWLHPIYHEFLYSPLDDNVLFIPAKYLHYPFYHYERPRFFNSATNYQFDDFEIFYDYLQITYEFYEDWLKSGGEDLQLGAHRLSNEQIFWIAAARVTYFKYPNSTKRIGDLVKENSDNLHDYFLSKSGFREAFYCDGA